MTRSATRTLARLAVAALGLSLVGLPAAGAHAATTTVGNGITTSDLSAVGVSATALAQDLAGSGVTVSNVTYTGAPGQAGKVHATDPAVVSFNDGVILSSGNIADVVGPNKSDGITGDMAGAADADLNSLIANSQTVNPVTFDAASLEFDFVPQSDKVYFTYTFGSDEYLEWVNLFNDVFAFYVNGTNCATVPNGDPVSIDTINSSANPQLFRDNSYSSPPANPINIESDGLSVEMICSATVTPGQTNHMKLAIADTSDQILDSVVMIKANSLSTTKPESCNDGVDNDDDTMVDMEDSSCTSTTTAPPAGQSGIGSGNSAPPFTGNEGTPITLDAGALGWSATPDTVTTSWTVTGINGTTGSCTVDPTGRQPLNGDGSIAVVTALCPADGEYVARVDGWDVENKSAFDKDVDFFVHNAPPGVTIDSPVGGSTAAVGESVAVSATVSDPGADEVSCQISWGDGTESAGQVDAGTCTGSHQYDSPGSKVITVTATDAAGSGSAAATVVDVSAGAIAPDAPAGLSATAGSGQAALSWQPPADGGAPIDGYNVQVGSSADGPFSDATGCAAPTATTCKVTGLTNGSTYYFVVRAHNAIGWGPASAPVSVVPASKPGSPTNAAATASGPGQLTATWTSPGSDGGAPVDKYTVRAYPAGSTTAAKSCAAVAPATTCTMSALTAGTYSVKVQAHNAIGWSALSVASAAVTTTGIPGTPAAPTAVVAGPGRISASWDPPASDGGETIDKYTVRAYAGGSSSVAKSCTALAPATSCSLTGLQQGTYRLKVQAHNAAGSGAWSGEGNAVTVTGIPGAPMNPAATWLSAGKAKATWDQPGSDGGEAIDKYTVRFYAAGSTTAAKSCGAIAPALSCSVANLPAGTYTVRVQAHNAAGWGPLSDTSAAITG